ncbi:hypothetical protein QJS10_CPB04g01351 [Acorus calamus]|uniref:Uncharacterized protein n=1 Tax=Acorus calamus TaxID=4465 RepID=A0AAV9EXM7_ACOCL|nr:hypothetical protein QJS10_CPB04g01351 [Acorus calamus]
MSFYKFVRCLGTSDVVQYSGRQSRLEGGCCGTWGVVAVPDRRNVSSLGELQCALYLDPTIVMPDSHVHYLIGTMLKILKGLMWNSSFFDLVTISTPMSDVGELLASVGADRFCMLVQGSGSGGSGSSRGMERSLSLTTGGSGDSSLTKTMRIRHRRKRRLPQRLLLESRGCPPRAARVEEMTF